MAPHSSTLAWKIPWMEEPGRLQSMESLRVGHDWATSLSLFTHAVEKEMANHSSVLAWRIPGTGEPGGLPSMGSHRVGHDWSDLAAAAWSLGSADGGGEHLSLISRRVGSVCRPHWCLTMATWQSHSGVVLKDSSEEILSQMARASDSTPKHPLWKENWFKIM